MGIDGFSVLVATALLHISSPTSMGLVSVLTKPEGATITKIEGQSPEQRMGLQGRKHGSQDAFDQSAVLVELTS